MYSSSSSLWSPWSLQPELVILFGFVPFPRGDEFGELISLCETRAPKQTDRLVHGRSTHRISSSRSRTLTQTDRLVHGRATHRTLTIVPGGGAPHILINTSASYSSLYLLVIFSLSSRYLLVIFSLSSRYLLVSNFNSVAEDGHRVSYYFMDTLLNQFGSNSNGNVYAFLRPLDSINAEEVLLKCFLLISD